MAEEEQKQLEGSDGGDFAATSEEATVSDLGDAEDSSGVGTAEVSTEALATRAVVGLGGDAGVTRSLVRAKCVAADGFEEDGRQFQGAHEIERDSQNPLTSSLCPETSLQLSPTSVTQSISSIASPTPVEQPPKIKDAALGTLQEDRRKAPSSRTSNIDGYNWRKYGQKQVKSPLGSRSYYRCTNTQCSAKKIECSDGLGNVTETINRSQHNHASPRKINGLSGSKVMESVGLAPKHGQIGGSSRGFHGFNPSTSSRKMVHQTPSLQARRKYTGDNDVDIAMSQASGDEPKKRVKRIKLSPSGPPLKSGNKAKVVMHATGDVRVSNDGYRWRKYGKKVVKGNQHPRNYYRCTSAGCVARKHIETTSDDKNVVIITYKGKHDHEKPVHRKRHGSPSASLVASAPPAGVHSSSSSRPKGDDVTQGSVESDSDLPVKAMELDGEKAMESARTLLSMGLGAKSYSTIAT